MRALICLRPGELVVEDQALERNASEALVAVRRVGICGTDYHIFEGKHPYLEYPRIMGHELAVEMLEAPPGSGLSVGGNYVVNPYLTCGHCIACRKGKSNACVNIQVLGVHRDGGMTERLSVPVANLIPSEGLSLDQCASVEFLAIGAHAVRRGGVSPGDRVLVVGAGPIGLGACLFARLAGARVVVLDRDPERSDAARSIANVETPAQAGAATDLIDDFTDGDGFDVVFDATGNSKAMEGGFEFVANGGRYVLVSVVKDAIGFTDPDFHRKEMTLLGSRNATDEDFETVTAAMRAGDVPVDRLITHRTSLRDAASNIPVWATQKSGLIKALIEID